MFLFVQEEGLVTNNGFGLDAVRDFLIAQGVDDAVAMDSGGASMLVIDTIIKVRPDFWREATMPTALHFSVP